MIKSVGLTATRNPTMTFQVKMDGAVAPILDFATAPNNPATGKKELWANFMGGPSAYFVWAVPQDGITAPADFNATASGYLRSIWNGAATGTGVTLVAGAGADAGYYIVTLTGVQVPAGSVMFTGGLGYSYNNRSTMPLTQTNLPAYPTAPSPFRLALRTRQPCRPNCCPACRTPRVA